MFTVEQIKSAHAKVKTGADYPRYVQELKKLGVHHYDYKVENGNNVYYDKDGNHAVTQTGTTIQRTVSEISSREMLRTHIFNHQQGGSDFPTFCIQAAEAGVERWSSNLEKMICSYYDKEGNEMYAEAIPPEDY